MTLRVLIGCEFSGVVRRAFRALGHDAFSCDLLPAEDGGEHLLGDVRRFLHQNWDLAIFHPPCTYLNSAGLHWNGRHPDRPDATKTEDALAFVRLLLAAPIPHIALENPTGCIGTRIQPASQYIQPHQFGEDASKKTGLWLKNLPLLTPTLHVPGRLVEWPRGSSKLVQRWANQTDSGQNKLPPSSHRWKLRSATYHGIAQAIASQFSQHILRRDHAA